MILEIHSNKTQLPRKSQKIINSLFRDVAGRPGGSVVDLETVCLGRGFESQVQSVTRSGIVAYTMPNSGERLSREYTIDDFGSSRKRDC